MSELRAKTETLGRIQAESDDGVLYVDTGFGSQMSVPRLDAKFLKALKKESPLSARAASIIYSYLFLILECDPNIPGCDADEDVRRLKALRIALGADPSKKSQHKLRPAPPSSEGQS